VGKEIKWETREYAEELYIVDGLTFEQVAEKTGVSVSQLKNWSAAENWRGKRREYRQALGEIKRNTVLLRKRLIAKALQSLDPQDVYAVSRLEAAAGKSGSGETESPGVSEAREIRTPEDAIEALQEAVEHRLNVMLSQPGALTLSAIKDMKKALELIDEMKARYREPEVRKRGLSDETVEDIRRRILGIS